MIAASACPPLTQNSYWLTDCTAEADRFRIEAVISTSIPSGVMRR